MDINQDSNRQRGVLDDDMNNSEPLTQTSATCSVGQGMDKDDSSSKDKDEKVLTTSESENSCKSETNNIGLSTDQLGEDRERSKILAESLCEEECDKENNPKTPNMYSSQTSETIEQGDENRRYEKNLKNFLENNASKEIRLRGQMSGRREIKSDGEIAKMTNFCGNMSKISLVLSKVSLKRSSAPPTYEDSSEKQLEIAKRVIPDKNSRLVPELNAEDNNSKTPVSTKNEEISLPINTPDNSRSTMKNFKLPVTPTFTTTTPGESSHPRRDSQGAMKTKDSEKTPVIRRPTDFAVKPRKAAYTFSPNSSGILIKCRSLPNINEQQRKVEKQRRSLVFDDERSRIVRSLFKDSPEPSTPETKKSAVPNRSAFKYAKEASASSQPQGSAQEKSLPKGTSDADRKSKICRRLTFAAPVNHEAANVQSTKADVRKEKPESPQKRKEISPQFVEDSPTSAKKVRTSIELKEEDAGSEEVSSLRSTVGEEKAVSVKSFSSSGEKKSSPVKRKSQEPYDSSSSKKK